MKASKVRLLLRMEKKNLNSWGQKLSQKNIPKQDLIKNQSIKNKTTRQSNWGLIEQIARGISSPWTDDDRIQSLNELSHWLNEEEGARADWREQLTLIISDYEMRCIVT